MSHLTAEDLYLRRCTGEKDARTDLVAQVLTHAHNAILQRDPTFTLTELFDGMTLSLHGFLAQAKVTITDQHWPQASAAWRAQIERVFASLDDHGTTKKEEMRSH